MQLISRNEREETERRAGRASVGAGRWLAGKAPGRQRLAGALCCLLFCFSLLPAQQNREEAEDPFRRWLDQDVIYIVSAEEKAVFQQLTTEDEKLVFIEQFWRTRDPDPSTPANEFREEHYRRIAYANENFPAGKPGWKTDRGMIYIKFGPPDRRQTNPTGGRVYRTKQELIASDSQYPEQHMTALPFEIWEYRHIEGLGQEVSFEFVSKEGGPDYKLALHADEKDALFFNTGSHLPKTRGRFHGLKTFRASPLDKVEAWGAALRPLPAKPSEEFVSAQVHFSEMPFALETEIQAAADVPMCRVRLLIPHSSLSFDKRWSDYHARVELEIFVRDVRKIVVAHRAEQLETVLGASELVTGLKEASAYQTSFPLPPGRYLVEVWIKDVLGGAASFDRRLVIVPRQPEQPSEGN